MGRNKPGKPHKKRSEQPQQSHDHSDGFEPDNRPFGGHPVNGGQLVELLGAALDGCTSCQDPLITLMVEDPTTTARMVSLACVAFHEQYGGLPKGLTDPERENAMASREFRLLAAAGVDQEENTDSELWKVSSAMTLAERRAALNSALDLLAGMV